MSIDLDLYPDVITGFSSELGFNTYTPSDEDNARLLEQFPLNEYVSARLVYGNAPFFQGFFDQVEGIVRYPDMTFSTSNLLICFEDRQHQALYRLRISALNMV